MEIKAIKLARDILLGNNHYGLVADMDAEISEVSRLRAVNNALGKQAHEADAARDRNAALWEATATERDRLQLELNAAHTELSNARKRLAQLVDVEADNASLRAEVGRMRPVVDALNDDALAESVARNCHDDRHDDRWCVTCEHRDSGISEYRDELQAKAGKDGAV